MIKGKMDKNKKVNKLSFVIKKYSKKKNINFGK